MNEWQNLSGDYGYSTIIHADLVQVFINLKSWGKVSGCYAGILMSENNNTQQLSRDFLNAVKSMSSL